MPKKIFNNRYLIREQEEGIAADIRNAREALDAFETACRNGEHPNRLIAHANDVIAWMKFSQGFATQAAQTDFEQRMQKAKAANKILRNEDARDFPSLRTVN